MHVQIALLKFKPELDRTEIEQTLTRYRDLCDIEGIIDVSVAENTSQWSRGYSDVIYIRAEDHAALDRYRVDPRRKTLAHVVDELEEHGIGMIFEIPDVVGEGCTA